MGAILIIVTLAAIGCAYCIGVAVGRSGSPTIDDVQAAQRDARHWGAVADLQKRRLDEIAKIAVIDPTLTVRVQ